LPDKSRFYYAKKALMTVAKLAANQVQFGIHNFTSNADGASNVQPLKMVVQEPLATFPEDNILSSEYINNINNMATVTYSPLAEGLSSVAGYYGSPSAGVVGEYCQKNFVIVVSSGISSEDQAPASQSTPASLSDYDNDAAAGGVGEGNIKENETIYSIPIKQNGSTYLDDVAYYLYSNDVVGYQHGHQNVMTYTIGFMGDHLGNLYLKNTSNNGNGNLNLYDTTHEEYGKYHYEAQDPDELSSVLLAAIKDILSGTSSFTAPVVPVTRTTSGNRIYMAFFKPQEGNFWEGNVTKFAIADDNSIIDANGNPATWPNGAIRGDAIPYWQTKDWADPTKTNYIHNASRNIYTYLGDNEDLTASSNAFIPPPVNLELTTTVLGNPTHTVTEIIDYVRGADVFDEDGDSDTTENRIVITGDVLHSEPLVLNYLYPDGSSKTMVYFGSNDGMLHAVLDETDPDVDIENNETNYGTEAWAFIPPDQLHRLKDMVEGLNHQYYVDASPKAYFYDVNADGLIDVMDKIILICGERKGGSSYFALDVTNPLAPKYLWRIDQISSKTGTLELIDTSIYTNPTYGGSF
jgi:type IV pilus assembly protein PilY1